MKPLNVLTIPQPGTAPIKHEGWYELNCPYPGPMKLTAYHVDLANMVTFESEDDQVFIGPMEELAARILLYTSMFNRLKVSFHPDKVDEPAPGSLIGVHHDRLFVDVCASLTGKLTVLEKAAQFPKVPATLFDPRLKPNIPPPSKLSLSLQMLYKNELIHKYGKDQVYGPSIKLIEGVAQQVH